MIVKIGKLIFDSKEEPILISFEAEEKILVSEHSNKFHICCYSNESKITEVEEWMNKKVY